MTNPSNHMTCAKLSFILLISSGVLLFIATTILQVDSPLRWGFIISSLLALPLCFFLGIISLMKENSQRGKIISVISIMISGVIMCLGAYKIF